LEIIITMARTQVIPHGIFIVGLVYYWSIFFIATLFFRVYGRKLLLYLMACNKRNCFAAFFFVVHLENTRFVLVFTMR
jgi:hypothetical protein